MPPRHPHSSDTSRRGEQRPTLPPIRQLFGQELSQAVPPQQSRQPSNSPELPFHRLALTDDDRRYMSRSPAPGSQSGNSAIARPLPSSLHSAPRQPVTLSHPSNVVDPRYNTRAYESSQPPQYPAQSHGRNSPYAPRIPDGAIVASGSYPYPSYSSPMPPGPSAAFRSGTEMASTERSSSSRYECSYCGKGFTRPSSLKERNRSHVHMKAVAAASASKVTCAGMLVSMNAQALRSPSWTKKTQRRVNSISRHLQMVPKLERAVHPALSPVRVHASELYDFYEMMKAASAFPSSLLIICYLFISLYLLIPLTCIAQCSLHVPISSSKPMIPSLHSIYILAYLTFTRSLFISCIYLYAWRCVYPM